MKCIRFLKIKEWNQMNKIKKFQKKQIQEAKLKEINYAKRKKEK